MAFDGNWILNTLGAAAGVAGNFIPGGQLVGSLVPGALQGLGSMFGLTDDSSSGGAATKQGIDALADAQKIASYTQSGMEGALANREAFNKSREYVGVNTADSLGTQNVLRGLGRSATSNGQQMVDQSRRIAEQQMGNNRRALAGAAIASGGGPAALAQIAGTLGNATNQGLLTAQQQGTQALGQGISQAGSLFGQADQARLGDLQMQLQNFQPFALQKFGGTSLGNLGGLAQQQEAVSTIRAAEDPLALLKTVGGWTSRNALGDINLDTTLDQFKMLGEQGNMNRSFGQYSPVGTSSFWDQFGKGRNWMTGQPQ